MKNEYTVGARYKGAMSSHMEYFSTNASVDKVRNIQQEVDKVKDIMRQNINDIIKRGEKLEHLDEEANRLQLNSKQFQSRSTSVNRALCMRKCKIAIVISIVVIVLIVKKKFFFFFLSSIFFFLYFCN